MTEEAQCIFHKDKVIQKIKDIIGGLKDDKATVESAKTAAESANTELQNKLVKCEKEKEELEKGNGTLKVENDRLTDNNEKINEELETLRGDQSKQVQELGIQLYNLRVKNGELNEEINKLKTDLETQTKISKKELEAQKTTSNENMNKIISTLVSERNRLLEESEESKKIQEDALAALAEVKDAALAQKEQAYAEKEAAKEKEQAEALAAKEKELVNAQADAKAALKAQAKAKEKELVDAQAALEAQAALKAQAQADALALQAELTKLQTKEAELTKCNQEKEELKQATESMKNIEKIQNFTNLSRTDIQTKLWETAKTYMESQFNNPDYKKTITSDPFVQVELKTLLNDDTEVTQDVTSAKIKEAHNKVIQRHYNTIYPNANNLEVPTKVTDHIVIPPYLYLSLTHFYTIFSFLETRQFYMRFLDQGQDQKQDLNLEPGFHIIIKKLGDGDQDFFSRVDVKFVLLETQTKAKEVIDKIFKESTFYGHIPTQTILQPGYTGNITAGGNKTLKNNKRRLKKRRKYTQSNRRK